VKPISSTVESTWSNTRLVEECVRGNDRAWHAIVQRYKNLVYSVALSYGAGPEDAADIFQSVWLELFNELPRLREAEALQGWLKRVAIHKSYQWKRQRAAAETDGVDETGEIAAYDALTPEILQNLEREQMVREAMDQLPPRCRKMIEMLFFEQPPVPYAEVAERLCLAKGSIGFIRGRCLKKLKMILESKGF
jgi:RNA polymerase sigma factor (sigma-70 family)